MAAPANPTVEPSFSNLKQFHFITHKIMSKHLRKGSSGSIWKKNINPLGTFHLPSSAMISLLVHCESENKNKNKWVVLAK